MGDRHYLCPHSRKLALSVCGDRSVLRHGGGLVHEPLPGSATRATGRAMALWQRVAKTTVILHSDRGCQFTSDEYQHFLKGHNLICSMSAVGSCADNAAAESFFGVLKRERIYRRQYRTRAEARTDIFDYIERFHNPRKRRQLEMRQQYDLDLTKPSVEMG